MITRLDWYIIKKFLGTFVFAIVLIIAIAVIFDFTERMGDFIDKDVPISEIIFDYYLNFIPYFANLFSYLFTFIAVIFFTSKMANHSEITAILSSGISFARFTRPYFISAGLIAILSFALGMWVIPYSNKERLEFSEKYLKRPYRNYEKNIHRQVEPGLYVYMESYNVNSKIAYKFSLERFEGGVLKSKLLSDFAKFNEETNKWEITNYYIRDIDSLKENITKGPKLDTIINIHPSDFNYRNTIVESMTGGELNAFIDNQRMHGVTQIETYLLEKYRRISDPFSTFILTLIGLSIASRKVKGGSGMHIGVGIALSFSYILFMRISSQFSVKGNFDPLLATWIPNLVFLLVGIYTYRQVPK